MSNPAQPLTRTSPRPTGTVTFLFSDIEGSTLRWETGQVAMRDALRRHDALVRDALQTHGGYVFKTIGDAFCAAFPRSDDALAAAVAVQRDIAAHDFSAVDGVSVRVAIHTGEADEREGDYFGLAVHRVARLLAIGHGGQVLVSGTTAELVEGALPSGTSLRDLGAHRLKDLARPEQVFQLVAAGMRETFPPLRSLDVLPNNLPRQLAAFIGRDEIVTDLAARLHAAPLVTLVGPGGIGKTRCAYQVGADTCDGTGDGVWLVELGGVANGLLVPGAIASVLGVPESPNRPSLESLIAYLRPKRLLLILDNCEHVLDEVRSVVSAILRGAPGVHILATSRERLNVAGERVYRLPSLAAPAPSRTITAVEAVAYPAVSLFVDRAAAADDRFALTDVNAPAIAEICRRLDGIPLAIELAAARVKVLSPQQLADRIDDHLRVLTSGDRSAVPRQHTLRALIDWSYEMLPEKERKLFAQLAIFAGSFSLETASAVCGGNGLDALAVLDLLASLFEKSLVQAESAGEETRYRLLSSTRQYAREKLVVAGEETALAQAHARACCALAVRLQDAEDALSDRAWYARCDLELENWTAAVEWALLRGGDPELGQRLAATLGTMRTNLPYADRAGWVRTALETAGPETPAPLRAALELADARLLVALGLYRDGCAAAERALVRFGERRDRRGEALARVTAGAAALMLGRLDDGENLLREALDERTLLPRRDVGMLLQNLGDARRFRGDFAGARARYAEALAVLRGLGAELAAASVAGNFAELEYEAGDAEAAVRLTDEVLPVLRAYGRPERVIPVACNRAAYLLALGRHDEAETESRAALVLAREVRDRVCVGSALQHLAAIAALRAAPPQTLAERCATAARLLGYVDAALARLQLRREHTEAAEHAALVGALEGVLGRDAVARLCGEGRGWREDEAVAHALAPQAS